MFHPAISGHRAHLPNTVYPLSSPSPSTTQAEPLREVCQGPEITWWSNYICECLLGNTSLEHYDEGELWQKMADKLKEEAHPKSLKPLLARFYGIAEEEQAFQMGTMAAYYLKEALIRREIYTPEYCVTAYLQSAIFFYDDQDRQNLVFIETFGRSLLFLDLQGHLFSVVPSMSYSDPIFAAICPILNVSIKPHPLLSVIKNRALFFLAQSPNAIQHNPFFSANLISTEHQPALQIRLNFCSLLMPLKALSSFESDASYFYAIGSWRDFYFHLDKSLYFPLSMSEESILAKNRDLFQNVASVEIKHVISAKLNFERTILSTFIHKTHFEFKKCLGVFVELFQYIPKPDLQALFKYCSYADQGVFSFYLYFLSEEKSPDAPLFAWTLSLTYDERYAPFVIDLWSKILEDECIHERFAFGHRLIDKLCLNERFGEAAHVLLSLSARGQVNKSHLRHIEDTLHKQADFSNALVKALETLWPLETFQNGALQDLSIPQRDPKLPKITRLKKDQPCIPFLALVKLSIDPNTGKVHQSRPDKKINPNAFPKRDQRVKLLSPQEKKNLRIKPIADAVKLRSGNLSAPQLFEYISSFSNFKIEELKNLLSMINRCLDPEERNQAYDSLIQQFIAFANQTNPQPNEMVVREVLYNLLSQCPCAKISFLVIETHWQAVLSQNPHRTLRQLLGLFGTTNRKSQECNQILLFGLKLLRQHTPHDLSEEWLQLLDQWPNKTAIEQQLLHWIDQPDFDANPSTLKIVHDLWRRLEGISSLFLNKPMLMPVRMILLKSKRYAKPVMEKMAQLLKDDQEYLNLHGQILTTYYSLLTPDFFTAAKNPQNEIAILLRADAQMIDWLVVFGRFSQSLDKASLISFWSVVWTTITHAGHSDVILSDPSFMKKVLDKTCEIAPEVVKASYQNIEPLTACLSKTKKFNELRVYTIFLNSLCFHLSPLYSNEEAVYSEFSSLFSKKLDALVQQEDLALKIEIDLWVELINSIFLFKGIKDENVMMALPFLTVLKNLIDDYPLKKVIRTLMAIVGDYTKSEDSPTKKIRLVLLCTSLLIETAVKNGFEGDSIGEFFEILLQFNVFTYLDQKICMLAKGEHYYIFLLLLSVVMRGYKIEDDEGKSKIFACLEKAVQAAPAKYSSLIINCLNPEWLSFEQIKSVLLQINVPTAPGDIREYVQNWDKMKLFSYLVHACPKVNDNYDDFCLILMNKYIDLLQPKFTVLLKAGLLLPLQPKAQFNMICNFFFKAKEALIAKFIKDMRLDDLIEFLTDFFNSKPFFLQIFKEALQDNDNHNKETLCRVYSDSFRVIGLMAKTNQYSKPKTTPFINQIFLQMKVFYKSFEIDDLRIPLQLFSGMHDVYQILVENQYEEKVQEVFLLSAANIVRDIYSNETTQIRDASFTIKLLEKLEQQQNPIFIKAVAQYINGQILHFVKAKTTDPTHLKIVDRWIQLLETDPQLLEMPLNLARKLKEKLCAA